ncbi:hypothetical protein AAW01_07430 [Aurantiacibacter gangjinensis]|uniref:Uncharacterized protein n=2 Tax=Aurantiacibacter gangjinensis TaxID=502682 RepID=A0A0G9MLC5_9SPHN|nr:hypothetical protein AAW01_07430 [Aurantiacibacter gangjinensis]
MAQLDRASRSEPHLASTIPDAFAANASGLRVEQAVLAGETEAALAAARQQIRLRPIPAESLSMLAVAANLSGDSDMALAALEEAARRGWRDPLAQLAAGEGALQSGDVEAAAGRVAALLATGDLQPQALDLFGRLVRTPDGRRAMAERYAAAGHWQVNSIPLAAAAVTPDLFADVMQQALELDADLPCGQLRALAEQYRRDGEEAAAARFWPGDCPA